MFPARRHRSSHIFYRNKAVDRVRQERDPLLLPQNEKLELDGSHPFPDSGDVLNITASQGTIATAKLLTERRQARELLGPSLRSRKYCKWRRKANSTGLAECASLRPEYVLTTLLLK
jgi:hypothetical protein